MSEIPNFHRILLESVNEENGKKNEKTESIFHSTSKNNLISIAKENLKSKNIIKLKGKSIQTNSNVKLPKIKLKSIKKKENQNENIKNDIKFTDKEYLDFMLHDLKYISLSIKKKQNKYNQNYSSNLYFKNRLSHDAKLKNRRKINDIKKMRGPNNLKTHNYNDINLLYQIIGYQEEEKPNYENKITITEDNLNLNDLYFDRFANQVLYKNRLPNDIDKMYIA
jgi:hypothetical protein